MCVTGSYNTRGSRPVNNGPCIIVLRIAGMRTTAMTLPAARMSGAGNVRAGARMTMGMTASTVAAAMAVFGVGGCSHQQAEQCNGQQYLLHTEPNK